MRRNSTRRLKQQSSPATGRQSTSRTCSKRANVLSIPSSFSRLSVFPTAATLNRTRNNYAFCAGFLQSLLRRPHRGARGASEAASVVTAPATANIGRVAGDLCSRSVQRPRPSRRLPVSLRRVDPSRITQAIIAEINPVAGKRAPHDEDRGPRRSLPGAGR